MVSTEILTKQVAPFCSFKDMVLWNTVMTKNFPSFEFVDFRAFFLLQYKQYAYLFSRWASVKRRLLWLASGSSGTVTVWACDALRLATFFYCGTGNSSNLINLIYSFNSILKIVFVARWPICPPLSLTVLFQKQFKRTLLTSEIAQTKTGFEKRKARPCWWQSTVECSLCLNAKQSTL